MENWIKNMMRMKKMTIQKVLIPKKSKKYKDNMRKRNKECELKQKLKTIFVKLL